MAYRGITGSNVRFPEPTNRAIDGETKAYLNDLVRSIEEFDRVIFSEDTGLMFQTARKQPFVEVTSNYAIGIYDSIILVNASAGPVALTLPNALDFKGSTVTIKKTDTVGANAVTTSGAGSESPFVLSGTNRPHVSLFSDGTQFWSV